MQNAANRDGPRPTAVCGLESQPSPWPSWSCLQAGAARSILTCSSGNPRKLLTATQCPMQLTEAQSWAGAALGSLVGGCRTRLQQGQPRQPLQSRDSEGLSLLAAAAQPLALAQPRKDFANFAHFWQRLKNITSAKAGDRQGGQILPHTGLYCGCGRAETSSSSRAPHGHGMGLSCVHDPFN